MSRRSIGNAYRGTLSTMLLCAAINAGIYVTIKAERPAYLVDYTLADNPDAYHYVLLGVNVWRYGAFSRCESPPYFPDMLRTPVYPVVAGGLVLVGGPAALFVFQACLQIIACGVIYQIGALLGHPRIGLAAALLFATDLSIAIANFQAMSETLANVLTLSGCYVLCGVATKRLAPQAPMWGHARAASIAGLLYGIAILTRPAVIVLLLAVFPVLLLGLLKKMRLRQAACIVVLMCLPAMILPGAWIARNHAQFGVAKLSNVGANNLVYFVAAGAYQRRYSLTLEEAQARIASDYHLPRYAEAQNTHSSGIPVKQVLSELESVAPRLLARHPRELVEASIIGTTKALVSHNIGVLAYITGERWTPPGTGDLLRMRPEALDRLAHNVALLGGALLWSIAHTGVLLGGTLLALWLYLTRAMLRSGAASLVVVHAACGIATIPLFGLEAYCRCRAPAVAFLCLLAGMGIAWLLRGRASAAGVQ